MLLLTKVMEHGQAIGCGDSRYTVGCWGLGLGAAASPKGLANCKDPSSILHSPHQQQHPGPTRPKHSSVGVSATWLVQCDRYCRISNHPRPLIGPPGNLHLIPSLVGGCTKVNLLRGQGVGGRRSEVGGRRGRKQRAASAVLIL